MTLTDQVLAAQHGGLWHTTSPERFDLISRDGKFCLTRLRVWEKPQRAECAALD